MVTRTENGEKPQKLKAALLLLWISLGLGVLSVLVVVYKCGAGARAFHDPAIEIWRFSFFSFFYWRLGKGAGWIRYLLVIFFVIGLSDWFSLQLVLFKNSYETGLISCLAKILQTIALVLLFLKPSSVWFREGNELGRYAANQD